MYNAGNKRMENTVNIIVDNNSAVLSTYKKVSFTQTHTTTYFKNNVYKKGLNTFSPYSTDHNKNKVLNI